MTSRQRSILAVAMLTQGVSIGLTYGTLPVFLEPLEVAFDASRTQISAGQILIMVAITAGSILTGIVLDRGYARRVMLAGALLMAAAQLVASIASNLWVLGLAALMAGFAVPSIGPLAAASLVTRSFDQERGRALGLMSMGPALGSGLFAALAGWAIIEFDWRQAYGLFAGIAVVVMVPIIAWAVPARFDLQASDTDALAGSGPGAPITMGALLVRPAFLWVGGVFALAAGVTSGWTVHVAAYLGGQGLDETQRSAMLALQYWMGVPGALFFGLMADRVSLTVLFSGMLGVASFCFGAMALEPGPLVVTLICVVFGFAYGGAIPLYMMLIGERLGPDAIGRAMGLSNLMMLPVMAACVLFAATVFESTGGYSVALVVFGLGLIGAIGCLVGSNRSARTA